MNVQMTRDETIVIPSAELNGTFRRFGERGPVYEIIGAAMADAGEEIELAIRAVESGEELNYPLRDLLCDPIER